MTVVTKIATERPGTFQLLVHRLVHDVVVVAEHVVPAAVHAAVVVDVTVLNILVTFATCAEDILIGPVGASTVQWIIIT